MKNAIRAAMALAVACALFAFSRAAAQPLVEPPGKAYVPGDERTFDEGVAAFDAGDYQKAFAIFSKLADGNDLAARRNKALMERKGLGTAKDPQAALEDYKMAARAGLPTAEADLGEMLLDGEAGPPDPKAALSWLERASTSGHPMAQFRLGEMYEKGEGVPQDYATAKVLYAAAAARGVKEAASRLSRLNELSQPDAKAEKPSTPPPAN